MAVTDPEIRLMLKAEQGIHRAGWDEPPRLYGIRRLTDRLRLYTLPMPPGVHLGLYLESIGEQFEEGTKWGEVAVDMMAALDGFHGFMTVSEAWGLRATIEEHAKIDRPFAEIPGATEIRAVCAVTVHGKHYFIERVRGEKPSIIQPESPGGRIPYGLTRMVLSIARRLPPENVDVPALEELKAIIERNDAEAEADLGAAR